MDNNQYKNAIEQLNTIECYLYQLGLAFDLTGNTKLADKLNKIAKKLLEQIKVVEESYNKLLKDIESMELGMEYMTEFINDE